jgi:hypothetical protein
VIALINDVGVIKMILLHFDLWETRNHDPPPGKVLLEFILENEMHLEQLTFTGELKYPDIDNHHNNRYENDYLQLPYEDLCLKHAFSR